MPATDVNGQLNPDELQLLRAAIFDAPRVPGAVLEVGTWLGGGSTLHFLRALQQNGTGHLWGIEADKSIYDRMVTNIRTAAPEAAPRFTPLFGFSQDVIPQWLAQQAPGFTVDVVFLDGGNRPSEQITEFELLDSHIPVGGQLLSHDAKLRKGKWLVPYVGLLDNWDSHLHDVSTEGLFHARKTALAPSAESLARAKRKLWKMRMEPAEVAAVLVPHSIRTLVLKCLPTGFSRELSDGRSG